MEKKFANFTKAAGVAVLAMGSSAVLAETVSVPASVTVNNAIDFTFTGTLNFGEVRAVADADLSDCAGLTLPANPASALATMSTATYCTASADAAMQSIGGTPERPVFTIAGVAPFTELTLTLPSGTTNLTAATAPPDSPSLELVDITAYKTSGTAGPISGGTITTDAAGGATFTVGGTLRTEQAAISGTPPNITYENLEYSGTFDVTVAY